MRRRAVSAPWVDAAFSTPNRTYLGIHGNMILE
jgi:hypothetical protein